MPTYKPSLVVLATSTLLATTSAFAGLLTVGGRMGYGIMQLHEYQRLVDNNGNISYLSNIRSGSGLASGIYGRLGEFAAKRWYLALTTSYNFLNIEGSVGDSTTPGNGKHYYRYKNTFEVGEMVGVRWTPKTTIFLEGSYSRLEATSSPDDRFNNFALPPFKDYVNGFELGVGIDAYLYKHIIATLEYQHGFYEKIYVAPFSNNNTTGTISYAPQLDTITLGLAANFA